ncbi:alpha/beta hydrolase fold domain-containing protein [Micromonospora sp. NPDC050980]|uniref:alpha/beta hydrolase n=1 Tax=Micromonospora sp. NPDC050980 TaxID=3155161 RepID=UPI0033F422C8
MTHDADSSSPPPDPLHPDARRLTSAMLADRTAPLRQTGVAPARTPHRRARRTSPCSRRLLDLAGCDVLRDEGLLFADRLRAAGVPVTCRVRHGQVHCFATDVGVLSTDAVITRLAHDLRELARAWRPKC